MINGATGKKKVLIIVLAGFVILLAAALLITGILALITAFIPDRPTELVNNIVFSEPDYEYDISNDEEYMIQDRRVWVDDGIISAPLDDEDFSSNTLYVFFDTYFKALQSGNGEALRACYSDDCVTRLRIPYKIPMQRVYDIMLHYVSSESATDANGIVYEKHVYRFEYKIMKNDGVFRSDLESDAIRPQLVTVSVYFDDVYISDVITDFRR